jgi:two-component system OmpR family sensor kinase
VTLRADGQLIVANDGRVVPSEALDRLTARFERAGARTDGSGLGLAIVAAIAERIGSRLVLESPRPGSASGFQASVRLPTEVPDALPQAQSPRDERTARQAPRGKDQASVLKSCATHSIK